MKENLESEVKSLREQVLVLMNAVNSLQQESEKKEAILAKCIRNGEELAINKYKLAKEKEKFTSDLQREKCNLELKSQLDIKTITKRRKRKLCERNSGVLEKVESEIINYKNEIKQLKDALRETLEANYNLSIRFLRMKSTKSQIKSKLRKVQEDQTKLALELETRISLLNKELNFMVNNKFQCSISPSNKRHLQLIKQNGNLLHENFCLQMEIERLTEQLDEMYDIITKHKLNKKLQYIGSKQGNNPNRKIFNKKLQSETKEYKSTTTNSTFQDSTHNRLTYPSQSERKFHKPKQELINKSLQKEQNNLSKTFVKDFQQQKLTHQVLCKQVVNERTGPKCVKCGENSLNQINKKKFEQKHLKKEISKNIAMQDTFKVHTLFDRNNKTSETPIAYRRDYLENKKLDYSTKDKLKTEVSSVKAPEIKPCDSDGLDLVQISEIPSKTTHTFDTDLGTADTSEFQFPLKNSFISSRNFGTHSCPDILQ